MLDRAVALVALLSMGAFLSVFVIRVPELDLAIVLIVVFLLAVLDFFGELLFRKRR